MDHICFTHQIKQCLIIYLSSQNTKYHKVLRKINRTRYVPLPININTINTIFDQSFENESDVHDFLNNLVIKKK